MTYLDKIRQLAVVVFIGWLFLPTVKAEVDKVYHPYVEQGTYEFETRLISLLDSELAANFSVYRFGFGKDFADDLFVEFYLIGARDSSQNFEIEAYEIEALYQFTEQGEYWVDFGLLFEIERERESKEWEGNIGFLFEKEFGRWSAALNIQNKYVYEDDKEHGWDVSQALQWRYRYSPDIEPGVELYSDSHNLFVGPVILGQVKLDESKLNWEVGIVTDLNHSTNESILRALIEYEF